ncbi:TPA: transcriptional regulator, partial [Aeromonas hydrophila]
MQQPQGETRWQSMTDNPMTYKGVAQSMGERLA